MNPTLRFYKYATLIQDIKDLLNFDWLESITNTNHEGNNSIDFAANLNASSILELTIHSSFPPGLSIILFVESAGTSSEDYSLFPPFCFFFQLPL